MNTLYRPVFPILLLSCLARIGVADQPSSPANASTPSVAIRNVRLFDGVRVTPNATVVFANGVITAAGAGAKVPAGAREIDGTGKTLLPGLIDSHTHAFGDSLERALRFGVTTELDMFTSLAAIKAWKVEQAHGNVAGRADIFSAGTLVTVAGGHGTEYFPIPTFTPGGDAQAFVDARIAEGSDYIKLVYEDGKTWGKPFPTLSESDLRALIAAVHKREMLAVVHISSLGGARLAIEAGADGLAHLFGEVKPDADFGKFVAAHHAFVVPTLTVIESTAGVASGASLIEDTKLKPFLRTDEIQQLRGSFPKVPGVQKDLLNAEAAVRLLRAARVPLLAGTDAPNPGTMHGASIHRELELLVQAGLTPVEALTAATSTPASAFRLKDRGRIAPGLRADLLLVNGDPTHDIKATRDIVTVWKGGVALDRPAETVHEEAKAEAPPALAAGLISNFDSGEMSSAFGSGWRVSTDEMMGGTSKATMEIASDGANGTAKALAVHTQISTGYPYPWAGAMFFAGPTPMKPVDVSSKHGLRFYAKGNVDIQVMIFAASLGRIPAMKTVHAGAEWTPITVSWSDVGIDGKDWEAVLFSGAQKSGPSDFWIDEVTLQ